ncbi:hypothetical protein CHISP_0077 [Chitinispirillum alkaliphilum]|nr:hypothetical protein CHISP_0077 [Chitinispirillum alkaliphilum]
MLRILLQTDVGLFIVLNSLRSAGLDWVFWFVSLFGNVWVSLPLVLGITLLTAPRKELKNKALFVIFVLMVNGIVTTQLKTVINRPRPVQFFAQNADLPRQIPPPLALFPSETQFDSITARLAGAGLKYQSFPSSHASTSFASAAVLFLLFGKKLRIAFLAAALISYSRIYLGVHFPLDLLGGMCTGIVVAGALFMVCRRTWDKNRK